MTLFTELPTVTGTRYSDILLDKLVKSQLDLLEIRYFYKVTPYLLS